MNEAGTCRKAVLSAPGGVMRWGGRGAFFVSREDATTRRGWVSGWPCGLIGAFGFVAPALPGLSFTSVAPASEPGLGYLMSA